MTPIIAYDYGPGMRDRLIDVMTGPAIVDAFETCWCSLSSLGSELTEEQWNSPSLCPGWSAKDALMHLTAAEHGFSQWEDPLHPPFDKIGAYAQEHRALSGADLLAEFERISNMRLEQLRALDEDGFSAPSWTAAGVGTYRRKSIVHIDTRLQQMVWRY